MRMSDGPDKEQSEVITATAFKLMLESMLELMVATVQIKCRYCGCSNKERDIYPVVRNGKLQGFCLPCYEEHLDDKRQKR